MISSAFLATSSVRCSEAASRQLHAGEEVPLVLLGEEAGGERLPSSPVTTTTPDQEEQAHPAFRIARSQALTYPFVARPKNRLNPS